MSALWNWRLLEPGLGQLWWQPGCSAAAGSHGAARRRALLPAASLDGPVEAAVVGLRELTLCDALAAPRAECEALLGRVRAANPELVLRLEAWWGWGASPEPLADPARLRALAPLFVHLALDQPALDQPAHGQAAQLTPPVLDALARMADAGVPLAAELYLRRGADAAVEPLRRLLLRLLTLRVRPYVLVAEQWLPPVERIAPGQALELVRGLRGWISGLAVPQLVLEQGDGRRVPAIPAYLTDLSEAGASGRTYRGEPFHYPNPPRGR